MTSGKPSNTPNASQRDARNHAWQDPTHLRHAVLQLTGGSFLGIVGTMKTNWPPETMNAKGVQEDC